MYRSIDLNSLNNIESFLRLEDIEHTGLFTGRYLAPQYIHITPSRYAWFLNNRDKGHIFSFDMSLDEKEVEEYMDTYQTAAQPYARVRNPLLSALYDNNLIAVIYLDRQLEYPELLLKHKASPDIIQYLIHFHPMAVFRYAVDYGNTNLLHAVLSGTARAPGSEDPLYGWINYIDDADLAQTLMRDYELVIDKESIDLEEIKSADIFELIFDLGVYDFTVARDLFLSGVLGSTNPFFGKLSEYSSESDD